MSKKLESHKENGRFSAKLKTAAVLRLLRGEDLDLLSREYKVTAAKLSQWRDALLAGGQAGLHPARATRAMPRSKSCRPKWAN